jgi:hypothetical protein
MAWTKESVTINNFERTFEVYRQESSLSCGPACVVMVSQLKYGTYTSEAIAKVWFAKVENKGNLPGVPKGTAKVDRVLNWRHESQMDTILRVLQTQKIGGNPCLASDVKDAASCTQHEPGILRVQWLEGNGAGGVNLMGGHFVVCVGHSQDNQWIYLDSEHGVVTVPAAPPYYIRGERMGLLTHLLQVS